MQTRWRHSSHLFLSSVKYFGRTFILTLLAPIPPFRATAGVERAAISKPIYPSEKEIEEVRKEMKWRDEEREGGEEGEKDGERKKGMEEGRN